MVQATITIVSDDEISLGLDEVTESSHTRTGHGVEQAQAAMGASVEGCREHAQITGDGALRSIEGGACGEDDATL